MLEIQDLLNQGLELIPINDIKIELDKNKTIGWDFTVEDNYTFATFDDIFVNDTMAVFAPLSNEAIEECKNRLFNLKSGESTNKLTIEFNKEMFVGIYLLSKDKTENNSPIIIDDNFFLKSENLKNPYINVIYRKQNTTVGKALINSCFPESYSFIHKELKKKDINKIISEIVEKYDYNIAKESLKKFYQLGFKFATIFAPSFTLDVIELPKKIYELKEKLVKDIPLDQAQKILDEIKLLLIEHLKNTGLGDLAESGAGKGYDQIMQILVAKGIIANAKGELLPVIKDCFANGLTNESFFNASYGARNGIVSRTVLTATTGYGTRKLVYVLNGVELDLYLKDCNTKRTIDIKLTSDMIPLLKGRYVIVENNKVKKFEDMNFKPGDFISLRSPMLCESEKICHTCYGDLLYRHKTPYVGVLAGTYIGEKATQGSMRAFHTGGAVSIIKRDILKDIEENNPYI